MEARAAEFGLDPAAARRDQLWAPLRDFRRRPPGRGREPGRSDSGTRAGGGAVGGDDHGWTDRAEGTGPLEGFELAVRASRPVACRWQAVGGLAGGDPLLDEALIAVRDQLDARLREPSAALDARLATITSALAALGRVPGSPLRVEDALRRRLDRGAGP